MDILVAATIAGVIIGGMTALASIWATVTQRLIDRRRVTLEMISRIESDQDILLARRQFMQLARENDGTLVQFARKEFEGTDAYFSIATALNPYELISTGIELGVIDFPLYRRIHRSTVLAYWDHAESFILEIRKRPDNKKKFVELESMVKWLKNEKTPPRARLRNIFY
ncbi:MAG: DUF4760 domain-containing protein [Rhizomicrobium sp.]